MSSWRACSFSPALASRSASHIRGSLAVPILVCLSSPGAMITLAEYCPWYSSGVNQFLMFGEQLVSKCRVIVYPEPAALLPNWISSVLLPPAPTVLCGLVKARVAGEFGTSVFQIVPCIFILDKAPFVSDGQVMSMLFSEIEPLLLLVIVIRTLAPDGPFHTTLIGAHTSVGGGGGVVAVGSGVSVGMGV